MTGQEKLERNKRNTIAFYDLMFNKNQPAEAQAKYSGATYIQRNPHVPDGKDGFISYFERLQKEWPGKSMEVVRAIAEGNHVVLHTHQKWPGTRDWATIDIFRLDDDGKILEHWDTIQEVPDDSANGNGMF